MFMPSGPPASFTPAAAGAEVCAEAGSATAARRASAPPAPANSMRRRPRIKIILLTPSFGPGPKDRNPAQTAGSLGKAGGSLTIFQKQYTGMISARWFRSPDACGQLLALAAPALRAP